MQDKIEIDDREEKGEISFSEVAAQFVDGHK